MESQQPDPFEWPPLESNPEVFTEYLQTIGLPKEWSFSQCFGFDDECLSFIPRPVIAVILAFEAVTDAHKQLGDNDVQIPFYMK
mmetsp:Transcript_24333/g.18507  ORF Transcript_24333/g.18507 Transcript_24333/m.18507 type:complete len:84 (+) Transcript_24333:10-261(+)